MYMTCMEIGKADYDYNNHCNRLQMITITIVIDPMPGTCLDIFFYYIIIDIF